MANLAINALTAKTPVSTDLVPVADPVTGIAGKSTVEEIVFGESDFPVTITPSQDSDLKVSMFVGNSTSQNNSIVYSQRQKSFRINQTLDYPTCNAGVVLLNALGAAEVENTAQTLVINAKKLSTFTASTIGMFPNLTTISAPNLKEGAFVFSNLFSLTSASFPELTVGIIRLDNTIVFTGTFSLPKFETGNIQINNATALTGVSAPEFTKGFIQVNVASTTSAPNFTTINLPKYKYSTGIQIQNVPTYTDINFPEVETIGINSNIIYSPISALTSINLPKLKVCSSILSTNGTYSALTAINCPVLEHTILGICNSNASNGFPVLTSINFPELISMGVPTYTHPGSGISKNTTFLSNNNHLNIGGSSPNLTTINLPKVKFMSGLTNAVNISAAPNLSVFTINPTPKFIQGNFLVTGAALNQASVDGILVALAYLDGTVNAPYPAYSSKTVNLSGGTSATPSATGLAAKATLVARGCTVTHN